MSGEVYGVSLLNSSKRGDLVLALGFLFVSLWYLVESPLFLCQMDILNWLLMTYCYIHQLVYFPTFIREAFFLQCVEINTENWSTHRDYKTVGYWALRKIPMYTCSSSGLGSHCRGEHTQKDGKNNSGGSPPENCSLDTAEQVQILTHSSWDNMNVTGTRSRHAKCQRGEGKWAQSPTLS